MIREAALAVELKMPAAQIEERRLLAALQPLGLQLNTLARLANTFGRIDGIRGDLLALLDGLGGFQTDIDGSLEDDERHE